MILLDLDFMYTFALSILLDLDSGNTFPLMILLDLDSGNTFLHDTSKNIVKIHYLGLAVPDCILLGRESKRIMAS